MVILDFAGEGMVQSVRCCGRLRVVCSNLLTYYDTIIST